ncbi:hypothetical protein WJX72_010320 [[Myrmecia] bisecta]|uniref:Uncharacterized protein n=1 Tax=[Myrmecia] bisecta TaxID=41462 RepID=A0AAW1Q259_9CHLO
MPKTTPRKTPRKRKAKAPETKQGARQRVMRLINRHAGSYWAEAQRTKWMVDLLVAVDGDYRNEIVSQTQRADAAEAQLAQLREGPLAQLEQQVAELTAQVEAAKLETAATEVSKRLVEAEMSQLSASLARAEAAAQTATAECVALQQAVSGVNKADSAVRRALTIRAHELKDNLIKTKHQLKTHRQTVRQQDAEMRMLQKEKEEAAALLSSATHQQHLAMIQQIADLKAQVDLLTRKSPGRHSERRAHLRTSIQDDPEAAQQVRVVKPETQEKRPHSSKRAPLGVMPAAALMPRPQTAPSTNSVVATASPSKAHALAAVDDAFREGVRRLAVAHKGPGVLFDQVAVSQTSSPIKAVRGNRDRRLIAAA